MSQSIAGTQNQGAVDFNALATQVISGLQSAGVETVPGADENLAVFMQAAYNNELPELADPESGGLNADALKLCVATLSMGGLSLEALMEAVGAQQRSTETKAGISSIQARAQERAQVNEEKVKQIEEELAKKKSQGLLDGFLKAFKIIGMVAAAIASVAMIAVGVAGLAAGGSGAGLIALGVISLTLLASSITEEATDGKVGFSPAFVTGKIMEACGASENAIMWTKMAVEILTAVVLVACSFGMASGGAAGNVANATAKGAQTASTAASAASTADKAAATAEQARKIANVVMRTATIVGGVNTVAQSATGIASAFNERDMSYLQAQRKRLEAILERISVANDLDMDHIEDMMKRSEQILQQVNDIIQEGVATNVTLMTGQPPAMA